MVSSLGSCSRGLTGGGESVTGMIGALSRALEQCLKSASSPVVEATLV